MAKFDIWHVAIPVTDLRTSVSFYCEGLGLKLLGYNQDGPRLQAFVKIDSKNFTLELFQPTENIEAVLTQKPHHIAFECQDIEELWADLVKRKAIPELKPIATFENGVKYLGIKDPDGVAIEFFQGRKIFDSSIS